MKRASKRLLAVCVLVACGVLVAAWGFRTLRRPGYELVSIGPSGHATAINEAGHVVGYYHVDVDSNDLHAFIWDEENGMRDLGTLGGQLSYGYGVNVHGQVVGESQTSEGDLHASSWDVKHEITDLGTLGGRRSTARAINDHGQIAGCAEDATGQKHAVVWDHGEVIDLGTLYGGHSYAEAINNRGQVVGSVICGDGTHHPFFWDPNSGMVDISGKTGPNGYATGINDAGKVVGNIFVKALNNYQAFIWDKEEGLNVLSLSNNESYALKINEDDLILGHLNDRGGRFLGYSFQDARYCFLRTRQGKRVILDRYMPNGCEISSVTGLNGDGWVVGCVKDERQEGAKRIYLPFLLKPTH